MHSREQALALAEKNVQQREEGCAVSSAQALHMVSEMQREVLETQVSIRDHEQLKAKLKAQQEQNRLLRLEAESVRSTFAWAFDTLIDIHDDRCRCGVGNRFGKRVR